MFRRSRQQSKNSLIAQQARPTVSLPRPSSHQCGLCNCLHNIKLWFYYLVPQATFSFW